MGIPFGQQIAKSPRVADAYTQIVLSLDNKLSLPGVGLEMSIDRVGQGQPGEYMYNLCIDRRVSKRRKSTSPKRIPIVKSDRRCLERRQEKRDMSAFPYLPEYLN